MRPLPRPSGPRRPSRRVASALAVAATGLAPVAHRWDVHALPGVSSAHVEVDEFFPRGSSAQTRKRKRANVNAWDHVSLGSLHEVHEVGAGTSSSQARKRKRAGGLYMWGNVSADSIIHNAHLLSAVSDPVDETPGLWSSSPPADPMHDAHLLAALADLEQAVNEARDEGFPLPSDEAVQIAGRLLRDMYGLRQCRFEVYPTEDGEVAVSAPGGHGRSVLVLCDSKGSVRCSVNLNGQHRRAVYDPDSAVDLPDGFVREALAALDDQ